MGSTLFHQERWADSAEAFRRALACAPDNVQAWNKLAWAELRQNHLESAQTAFERCLTISPNPDVAMQYAMLLIRRNLPQEAAHILRQIIEQVPGMQAAWQAWGDLHGMLGQMAEAEAAYRRLLEIDPKNSQARHCLALTLLIQYRISEAEAVARSLVVDEPENAEAWEILGGIEQSAGKTPDAIKAFQRSVELDPIHSRFSRWLSAVQYAVEVEPEALSTWHRQWESKFAPAAALFPPPAGAVSSSQRPLRIGFISGNFERHPVAFLALPMLENIDRTRCTVLLYSDKPADDLFASRFKRAASTWHDVSPLTDYELAALVRSDEVDVLIDLMGHTGPRLPAFAMKPAAVQAAWLGYVGTTGLLAMDWLIADRYHVRPGEERWYCEGVLRLPHSYAAYGPPPYLPAVNTLPVDSCGMFTFGSLSNPAKFTSQLLDAWATILRRTPRSQLLLGSGGLNEKQIQEPIIQRFIDNGISPDRLIFKGASPHPDFLATYQQIDLALDTQPYSGGLTTCESLWMGVPVITYPGRTFAGRHATSYLSTAGLSEFIAADCNNYVDLAASWACRIDDLRDLRATLRSRLNQSPVADAQRFAHDFLAALTLSCFSWNWKVVPVGLA